MTAPALHRLLAPSRSATDFATDHWGRQVLLVGVDQRDPDDTFADLFSLNAVDELIADRGLRAPFLRVANQGRTLPESAFTAGGGIGAGVRDQVSDDKVLREFGAGATLVLQGLHRTWAPIVTFSQQLASDLGHPVQVNAYVTPPQSQGFSDHYDVHDVFVLQIHGEKRWIIHDPVLRAPLRDQPWSERSVDVEEAADAPPVLDATLRPGDVLYLPRGYIHAAQALGGTSVHLTVGVHQWTRHHLSDALLQGARAGLNDHEQVRESLPLGVELDEAGLAADIELARQSLLEAVREAPAADVVEALQASARGAQRPAPLHPMAQLAALEQLGPDSTLQLRPALMLTTATDPGSNTDVVLVRSRAGRFAMETQHLPALSHLRQAGSARVCELDPDGQTALAAARLLVRQGVATVGAR